MVPSFTNTTWRRQKSQSSPYAKPTPSSDSPPSPTLSQIFLADLATATAAQSKHTPMGLEQTLLHCSEEVMPRAAGLHCRQGPWHISMPSTMLELGWNGCCWRELRCKGIPFRTCLGQTAYSVSGGTTSPLLQTQTHSTSLPPSMWPRWPQEA